MTYEEKLELAQSMRAKSVFEAKIPEELNSLYQATRRDERHVPTSQGDCKVYFYYPETENGPFPLYINFHGGGFVRQWRENDAMFCCKMVAETGCICADIDYKLAPEHPYPTAPRESHDAIQWMIDHAAELNIDPANIVVGGHSAGGNLTATTTLLAIHQNTFRVKGLIMDYPGVDNAKDPGTMRKVEGAIPVERMRQFCALYHADPEHAKEPFSSPLLAADEDLAAFPPTAVITAEVDNLRDDGEAFAQRLVAVGVPVVMRRFNRSRHGFAINFVDEYELLMQFYAELLRAFFGATAS